MSDTYEDYFEIDENYYPEINEHSWKHVDWRKTFPHKTFIGLLKSVSRMLARTDNLARKGIWIEGAYGTGKSHVARTLQCLLQCPEDELSAYFDEYPALRKENDLRDRLLVGKRSGIVTAFRDSSGSITSTRHLVMAVFESVSRALDEAGVRHRGENTLRGAVLAWLADEANRNYFADVMALPENRGRAELAGRSVDDVVRRLKDPDAVVTGLMDDILSLAEDRGITALQLGMDDLVSWLTDVLRENDDLGSVVLVWDEFSSFFKNNRNALDEFQKLAHLSNDVPFYLIIVTHMSGSIFAEGDQAGRVVSDRFTHVSIEMPDNIAFELMAHALKPRESLSGVWQGLVAALCDRTRNARPAVCRAIWRDDPRGEGEKVLRGILPIHPLAALLLKHISAGFASNQRSMFNFIKGADTEDLHAFQWFCANHGPLDDENLLTADLLWDFFYAVGADGRPIGGAAERHRAILDAYPRHEARLDEDERRVLKVVLVLEAVSRRLNDKEPLFLPTPSNMDLVFEGTSLERGRARGIARKLVRDGILFEIPGTNGDTRFAIADVSPPKPVDPIKQRLREGAKTLRLVQDADLASSLFLGSALKSRYEILPVTVENFTMTANKCVAQGVADRRPILMAFAGNEAEQGRMRKLVADARQEEKYDDLVLVDASDRFFGDDRFEQWLECTANEVGWRDKDGKRADEMGRRAKGILEDWKQDVADGAFVVWTDRRRGAENCLSAAQALKALSRAVLDRFPLTFDNAQVTDNMFMPSQMPNGVKLGIREDAGGVFQKRSVDALLRGVRGQDRYWETSPGEPLSRLKIALDGFINDRFSAEGRVSVREILGFLAEHGFLAVNLYAYLAGFLLREYADQIYRWSDGGAGGRMDADRLAEIVGEGFRNWGTPIRHYRDKFIEEMTEEQRAFLDFVADLLGIECPSSVETAAAQIRARLRNLGAPIWCLAAAGAARGLEDWIDGLLALANPDNSGAALTETASRLGGMARRNAGAAADLRRILTRESVLKALRDFLDDFEGGALPARAAEIGVGDGLVDDARRRLDSGESLWLWNRETAENELRALLRDYDIVAISNGILARTASGFDQCVGFWREWAEAVRMPADAVGGVAPALKAFLSILRVIVAGGDLPHERRDAFLEELRAHAAELRALPGRAPDIFYDRFVRDRLKDCGVAEAQQLYAGMPPDSFLLPEGSYDGILRHMLPGPVPPTPSVPTPPPVPPTPPAVDPEQERAKERLAELRAGWKELSGASTPRDWSRMHRTPILCLLPEALRNDAGKAFAALDAASPAPHETETALGFLEEHGGEIAAILREPGAADAAFLREIVGRWSVLLTNADAVRSRLEKSCSGDAHGWFGSPEAARVVEEFAEERWKAGEASRGLVDKIGNMDAERAKQWLQRLVSGNFHVGVAILNEEKPE